MIPGPARAGRLARSWLHRKARRTRERHALILMYHRVTPSSSVDPWNLIVEPENFRDHIEVLSRLAHVVPLEELPGAMRNRREGHPVVAITFDDGYQDNLEFALPVLENNGCPATVFLATGWIGRDGPFWWDRLAWIVLAPGELPEILDLQIGETPVTWSNPERSAPRESAIEDRETLHRRLWMALRLQPDPILDAAMEELAVWAGLDAGSEEVGRPMSEDEARRMVESGTVSIGAHAHTHRPLAELPPACQESEIQRSLDRCEQIVGYRPDTFAYPHGSFSNATIEAVTRSGVTLACSSEKDLAWEDSPPLALPRAAVMNSPAATFERWLRWYWLP
jgi:peptidoglycan/xylan/chitin deacetylase (PgdA/CDA1 family)